MTREGVIYQDMLEEFYSGQRDLLFPLRDLYQDLHDGKQAPLFWQGTCWEWFDEGPRLVREVPLARAFLTDRKPNHSGVWWEWQNSLHTTSECLTYVPLRQRAGHVWTPTFYLPLDFLPELNAPADENNRHSWYFKTKTAAYRFLSDRAVLWARRQTP